MSEKFTHEIYMSPFSWRYGSDAMRRIWSVEYQRHLWRRVWVALANAQHTAGLVSQAQLEDLKAHEDNIDIERAETIEAEIQHDLMAEVRTFAEQCPVGGGIIHLGATSMDIEDNADALRLRASLDLILDVLRQLLEVVAKRIDLDAEHVCMAYTHLQPAEPTTVGYRLANYAQDLLSDYTSLQQIRNSICGKGIKGAVGTSASYHELLQGTQISAQQLEALVMKNLNLIAFPVTHQTYPRRQDWVVVSALSGLAMTLYRFAFDLRLLQSPQIGEWAEPFGHKQVGSSAMPFKRNPINAENMDSLARYVAQLPQVLWGNGAHNLLERTLDDSANRRIVLPQAFLATDELLSRALHLLTNLRINDAVIDRNLQTFGTFAATERVLMAAVRNGGDRQDIHEIIREHSLSAWEVVQAGGVNPLAESLATDDRILQLISRERVQELMDATHYVGDAPQRARAMSALISETLQER